MNKRAVLQEIYQSSFNDELEKVALSTRTMKSALRKMINNAAVHKNITMRSGTERQQRYTISPWQELRGCRTKH